MKFLTIRLLATLLIAPLTLWFAPAALAQEDTATPVQIVALDECDPTTFNAALGPEFCKNVALAFAFPSFVTKFADLFAEAAAGHPDPGWDFEPDRVTITKGTPLVVVNQGGEPHTFTEVAKFGGGFIPPLMEDRLQLPNAPAASRTSRRPGLASFKAASCRLRVCRGASICSSVVFTLGCA